jgi:hypothetical protein
VVALPVQRGPRCHRNTGFRILDDGCKNGIEAELAEILRQPAERIDSARKRNGLRRAEQRHMGVSRRAHLCR